MPLRWILPVLCVLAGACGRQPDPVQTSANAGAEVLPAPAVQRKPQPEISWAPVRLEAGDAWLDCGPDYHAGDGRAVLSLDYIDLREAMQDCRATGLVRLRYAGKVVASFAALAERAGRVATDLGIGKRILDIDSTGGHVEAAIRAGDAIGENDWTIWVRGDSQCHSACVLLLASGDMRVIAGPVGIHRMIRVRSAATSRRELGEELRAVSDDLRNYLERNGASAEVYDLMTTVPNRALRILSPDELERFGLSGPNAVEDDLDRIRLARQCGLDFVNRRDAFRRAYDAQCLPDAQGEAEDVSDINHCGLELRKRFRFPDATCPEHSPMSELDGAVLAMPSPAPAPDAQVSPALAAPPVAIAPRPRATPEPPKRVVPVDQAPEASDASEASDTSTAMPLPDPPAQHGDPR